MTAAALVLTLALCVAAPPERVLPPEASGAVSAMLRPTEPLGDGNPLRVLIDKSRIRVSAGPEDALVLSVTLVHPDAAAADAPRAGGLALLTQPGPAPEILVERLLARLETHARPLPWRESTPKADSESEAESDSGAEADSESGAESDAASDSEAGLTRRLQIVREHLTFGLLDQARNLLAAEPLPARADQRVRLAALWWRLGDTQRAKAIAQSALALVGEDAEGHAATRLTVAFLTSPPESWADLVPPASPMSMSPDPALLSTAEVLRGLGRHDVALRIDHAVREAHPDRADAWAGELISLTHLRRLDEADSVARQALERHPDDEVLLASAAGLYRVQGDKRRAADLYERLARKDPTVSGRLRLLMTTRLHDPELDRAAYEARLRAALAKDPGDEVSAFELGVLLHYDNRFEASTEVLAPLEPRLGSEHRLHVYLAMNDFNLGRRDAALARLNAAAELPDPDPDIYYCRAEVVRDTDRPLAIADLERYLAASERSGLGSPSKPDLVRGLRDALEACLADGRPVCEADWEHPRLEMAAKGGVPLLPLVAGGAALAGLGLWLVLRRRPRSPPS